MNSLCEFCFHWFDPSTMSHFQTGQKRKVIEAIFISKVDILDNELPVFVGFCATPRKYS